MSEALPKHVPNFPELTDKEIAADALKNLDSGVPWNTTFLFLEPGCEQVGQGTELAKAIEQAMAKSFRIWSDSWVRPHLEDIANRP